MRIRWIGALALAAALLAPPAAAATYQGQNVDGKWFGAKLVNSTFGAYETHVKFQGDRVVYGDPSGASYYLGTLEDEEILDPHDVQVYDARRGVWWSVSVRNLRP